MHLFSFNRILSSFLYYVIDLFTDFGLIVIVK